MTTTPTSHTHDADCVRCLGACTAALPDASDRACPRPGCRSTATESFAAPALNSDEMFDGIRCLDCGLEWVLDPGADADCTLCGGSGDPGGAYVPGAVCACVAVNMAAAAAVDLDDEPVPFTVVAVVGADLAPDVDLVPELNRRIDDAVGNLRAADTKASILLATIGTVGAVLTGLGTVSAATVSAVLSVPIAFLGLVLWPRTAGRVDRRGMAAREVLASVAAHASPFALAEELARLEASADRKYRLIRAALGAAAVAIPAVFFAA